MIHRQQNKLIELVIKVGLVSVLLLLPVSHAAQGVSARTPNQEQAQKELNEAARAYREGNFAEAQRHSERALELDPENRSAPMFIARTIHAQYKPGDMSPENLAKAREAIFAYQQLLLRTPNDDESYKAIAYLYGAIKEEELLRDWLLKRAGDSSIQADKRAEAYIVLASKDWDCSFKITELPTSKVTTVEGKKAVVQYLIPKDKTEYAKAVQCANRGLEMAEQAVVLNPENETAWSYKANLLLELVKLMEMSGDAQQLSQFQRRHDEALVQATNLSKAAQSRTEKPD